MYWLNSGNPRKILVVLSFLLMSGSLLRAEEGSLSKADRLFAARDSVQNLKQAVAILEASFVRDPTNWEILWRLAKYKNYLADRAPDKESRIRYYEAAIGHAKRAIEIDDKRPEGHFWLAANYGQYAELKGPFKSLSLLKTIRQEFERALAINSAFDQGNAYLALGEMYLRLPRLLGGNDRLGLELLETGLKVGPANAELHITLAEYYLKNGRKSDARRLLETVLTVDDPLQTPKEMAELRDKSKALLEQIGE
jgi:tetratricopeptide (TPR) repeat protein